MDKESLEKLKSKWCEELEEVLHCPVCLEKPGGRILQCTQGHHLCESCKSRVVSNCCPTCKGPFKGGRCYVAETMLSKIEDTKKCMEETVQSINNFYKANLVDSSSQYSEIDYKGKKPHIAAAKGFFPCRIGTCTKEEAHCRMMEHIRNAHKDRLKIGTSDNYETYTSSWNINYSPMTDFDTALHVANMELFIIHLSLDTGGNFMGNVQIVNTEQVGKHFTYKLEIKGKDRSCSYTGKILSCRLAPEVMIEKSLHIHSSDVDRMLNDDKTLECVIMINRSEEEPMVKNKIKKTARVKRFAKNNKKMNSV